MTASCLHPPFGVSSGLQAIAKVSRVTAFALTTSARYFLTRTNLSITGDIADASPVYYPLHMSYFIFSFTDLVTSANLITCILIPFHPFSLQSALSDKAACCALFLLCATPRTNLACPVHGYCIGTSRSFATAEVGGCAALLLSPMGRGPAIMQ